MTGRCDGSRLISDIDWQSAMPELVDTNIKQLLTAAAFIEARGDAYGEYLLNVFSDDEEFSKVISKWSDEENEHGIALSSWLERADPEFDFKASFERFSLAAKLSYQEESTTESIRGSKTAELLSRCAVESGTSTYYRSVAEKVGDPTLKVICERLSQDEVKHYTIFRKKLDDLKSEEQLSGWSLLKMAISRLFEVEDEQMGLAYYISRNSGEEFDEKFHTRMMIRNLYSVYSKKNIRDLIKLNLRSFGGRKIKLLMAIGYDRSVSVITFCVYRYMRMRVAIIDVQIDLRRIRTWMAL
jgi:rubrerythrin